MTAKLLLVVAAALMDHQGRILLAQRPDDKNHGGLWEFPGGKVEQGEVPEMALIRELREELGVDVAPRDLQPLHFSSLPLPAADTHMLMPLYLCRQWQGVPQALEHQQLAWVTPDTLDDFAMPPADLPFISVLRRVSVAQNAVHDATGYSAAGA